jgi:hypothetical protein
MFFHRQTRERTQNGLCVDRHLTAILKTIIVVHHIWLRVIKSSVAVIMRTWYSIGRTRKNRMTRSVAHFPRQWVTQIGKVMLAIEIST